MTEMNADDTYPYCPSNGTEGEMFMEKWCYRCRRDAEFQKSGDGEDGCDILLLTMLFYPKDPEYPPEWISDDNVGLVNPRCTAFEPVDV